VGTDNEVRPRLDGRIIVEEAVPPAGLGIDGGAEGVARAGKGMEQEDRVVAFLAQAPPRFVGKPEGRQDLISLQLERGFMVPVMRGQIVSRHGRWSGARYRSNAGKSMDGMRTIIRLSL